MFDEIFRHEKVEMTIPTFSSQICSPHFACKIKTNESAACLVDFSSEFASWKPAFRACAIFFKSHHYLYRNFFTLLKF